jgi:hypothetical protein
MSFASTLKKHGLRIGHKSDSYPSMVKQHEGDALWEKFNDTQTIKDVRTLYETNADILVSILFINYLNNITTNAFVGGKKYEASQFSLNLITTLLKTVNIKLNELFRRKNLLVFRQGTRSIDVGLNYNSFLHASALPNVSIYQNLIIPKGNMDAALHSLKGFLYRDFPKPLSVDRDFTLDSIKKQNIYSWFFVGDVSGIKVHLKRLNKDILCLKISFDFPYVLPMGKYTKQSFHNLLIRSLNSFNAGY